MKFASFRYDTSVNLGDQVQSFAAEQYLPRLDYQVDRDSLHQVEEPTSVIMNGWFSDKPENWPPSPAVNPLFFGFHMTWYHKAKDRFLEPESIAYLKTQEPIGCRDSQTRDWLREKGVDAFYSKCLTLTFPKREHTPENGKVFLVDVEYHPISRELRRRGVKVSQMTIPYYDDATKRQMMKQLLQSYHDEAALVITSKLHCAMPCLAMGIPVIFIGRPDDYRTQILRDVGLEIQPYRLPKNRIKRLLKWALYETLGLGYIRKDIWNPKPLDIEATKAEIVSQIKRLRATKFSVGDTEVSAASKSPDSGRQSAPAKGESSEAIGSF